METEFLQKPAAVLDALVLRAGTMGTPLFVPLKQNGETERKGSSLRSVPGTNVLSGTYGIR